VPGSSRPGSGLGEYVTELRVLEASSLIGKNGVEAKLGEEPDISVLEIGQRTP